MKYIYYLILLCILTFYSEGISKTKISADTIEISINLLNSVYTDTVMLEVFDYRWNQDSKIRYKTVKNEQGKFKFNIPVNKEIGFWQASVYDVRYDTLSGAVTYRAISIPFMWEFGDKIECEINNTYSVIGINSTYNFRGKKKEKYVLKAQLESIPVLPEYQDDVLRSLFPFNDKLNYVGKISNFNLQRIKLLAKEKKKLNQKIYDAYLTDIIYPTGKSFYSAITNGLKKHLILNTTNYQLNNQENFVKSLGTLEDSLFFTKGFLISQNGIDYLFHRLKAIQSLGLGQKDPIVLYNFICEKTNGLLRENLLIYFFRSAILPEEINHLITNSGLYFYSKDGIKEYEKIKKLISGNNLFSKKYELLNEKEEPFILDFSKYKDKIVVIDFYYTGCGPCRTLYKNTISTVKKYFEKNENVLFLAISIDRNYEYWLKGIKNQEYSSISLNTINLFSGETGINHPIFLDNNIDAFPKVIMLKDSKVLYYNTENLKSETQLIETITKQLKK